MSMLPFLKRRFINRINSSESDGLIITGDISNGMMLESHLRYLATHYDRPIYFVLGNHDYYWRHRDSVESDVRRLCRLHDNLHWLSDEDEPVSLKSGIALVGDEGWYDVAVGGHGMSKWCIDRLINLDYLPLASYDQQVEVWKERAHRSTKKLISKINDALDNHDVVYVATHFPPWVEASRSNWQLSREYWLSYNTNFVLGQEIENLMKNRSGEKIGRAHV